MMERIQLRAGGDAPGREVRVDPAVPVCPVHSSNDFVTIKARIPRLSLSPTPAHSAIHRTRSGYLHPPAHYTIDGTYISSDSW